MSEIVATERWVKMPEEVRTYTIDGTHLLASGETFSGTPTITVMIYGGGEATGLTLSSKTVNAAAVTKRNGTIAIGKGLQVTIAGGTAGVVYLVKGYCATNISPEVVGGKVFLDVKDE